ncbi:hypothetical protein [Metallibacterium scheffleri]|uniref:hypothetical protein n=1 Tax=Metallibacterium scheffleri TaxID=993689 RepID=UPI0023F1F871|nr:hypothetical protein [Metallibacterium scheffleri]
MKKDRDNGPEILIDFMIEHPDQDQDAIPVDRDQLRRLAHGRTVIPIVGFFDAHFEMEMIMRGLQLQVLILWQQGGDASELIDGRSTHEHMLTLLDTVDQAAEVIAGNARADKPVPISRLPGLSAQLVRLLDKLSIAGKDGVSVIYHRGDLYRRLPSPSRADMADLTNSISHQCSVHEIVGGPVRDWVNHTCVLELANGMRIVPPADLSLDQAALTAREPTLLEGIAVDDDGTWRLQEGWRLTVQTSLDFR